MSIVDSISPDRTERAGRYDWPNPSQPTGYPSASHPTPAGPLRAIAARLTAVEHELAEARAALLAAEAAFAGGGQQSLVPDAYTTEQLAHALGLSRSTIAEMLRRGEIRSVKLGGSRRVFRADLDAYIAAIRNAAS